MNGRAVFGILDAMYARESLNALAGLPS